MHFSEPKIQNKRNLLLRKYSRFPPIIRETIRKIKKLSPQYIN